MTRTRRPSNRLLPRSGRLALMLLGVWLLTPDRIGAADAAELAARLPEGNCGIAARYPGDTGIANDADVVFVEAFEHDSLEALVTRWETVGRVETMSFSPETPPGSGGRQSLLLERQEGAGGSLYRRIRNEEGGWGYDRLFLRYYVKFAPDCGEIHHGVSALGGNHPATPFPVVSAGNAPDGSRSFWSGIEPYGSAWVWDYYTYWSEMRGSPPAGQTWGNSFIRDPDLTGERGRWICIEHMIQVNDIGQRNGEQALWIDGRLVSHLGEGFPKGLWVWDKFHPGRGGQGVRWGENGREDFQVPEGGAPFEGFRWRDVEGLNVNFIWLYIYTQRPAGHHLKVWFDDVVAATSYIGPIQAADD